jgi:hypothetical protein
MQRAFLGALMDWAARGVHDKPIVLPTGRVDPFELVRVVTALKCIGANRRYSPASGDRRHLNKVA